LSALAFGLGYHARTLTELIPIRQAKSVLAFPNMPRLSLGARLAWGALVVNLVTILGGALVRATGSGAGCGESWPSCKGSVVPGLSSFTTQIEFSHRVTSGLALISVVVLFVSVYRNFEKGSQARRSVNLCAIAIVVESLLGAWLVLARLVEDNATVMRAIAVPIHLVNTLFLIAALTSCAWILSNRTPLRWPKEGRKKLWLAAGGLVLLGMTGGIAALADTLFPVESLGEGIRADLDTTAHFLTRLRVVHPILAIGVGAFLLHVAGSAYDIARPYAIALMVLVGAQVVLGVLNVLLLTPIPMQLLHLLLADLLWISVLVLAAEMGRASEPGRAPVA